MHTFRNAVSWFEVPAADINRAKRFYEAVFETTLHQLNLANDLQMALFPVVEGSVGGAICQHPDFYRPGQQGPLIYLNANPDLGEVLNRVERNGGTVLISKRQISPEVGYMAVFLDCEGNRIALISKE
jgi:predicted enzyme related to lactoylglutathione lyase